MFCNKVVLSIAIEDNLLLTDLIILVFIKIGILWEETRVCNLALIHEHVEGFDCRNLNGMVRIIDAEYISIIHNCDLHKTPISCNVPLCINRFLVVSRVLW